MAPSAKLHVPILHDVGVICVAEGFADGGAAAGSEEEGEGGITTGSRVGRDGPGASLVGGRVNIVDVPCLRPKLKVRGRGYNRGNGTILKAQLILLCLAVGKMEKARAL